MLLVTSRYECVLLSYAHTVSHMDVYNSTWLRQCTFTQHGLRMCFTTYVPYGQSRRERARERENAITNTAISIPGLGDWPRSTCEDRATAIVVLLLDVIACQMLFRFLCRVASS